jgi:outer membrane biosynthesis protein TonB
MKIKELIARLEELREKHSGEALICVSIDEEGNEIKDIDEVQVFKPSGEEDVEALVIWPQN